jgi:gamma-glutamyltranspeptidase/glutathione hydrolase
VAAFTRDGVLIPVGERWFRPEYARTLEAIAADPEAFYKGAIADAVAKSVQERGGLMTVDDIKAYQPIWREPLSATYGGFTVYAPPAPASGAVLLSALQTLDIIAPPPAASKDITEVETAHKTVEALRLAYGQRNLIGDPAFVPGLDTLQAKWLAPGAAKERAARVGDKTNNPEFYLA